MRTTEMKKMIENLILNAEIGDTFGERYVKHRGPYSSGK